MTEDRNQRPDDPHARQSFTFRRMRGWQLSALIAVLAVILVVLVFSLF